MQLASCSHKVESIHGALNDFKLDQSYKYSVVTKEGKKSPFVPAEKIKIKKLSDALSEVNSVKIFKDHEILSIDGLSVKKGNYAKTGALTGALITGIPLGLLFGFGTYCLNYFSSSTSDCHPSVIRSIGTGLWVGGVSGLIGGLLGLAIGASIPKYDHVRLIPSIEPTKDGIKASTELQIQF